MSDPGNAIHVTAYTATSALGHGIEPMLDAIRRERSGLRPLADDAFGAWPLVERLPTWVGRVDGLGEPLPAAWTHWDCRNNRLAWLALNADGFRAEIASARERHGPDRVGIVLGTSTSSIGSTEDAYRALDAEGRFPAGMTSPALQSLNSLTAFVREVTGLGGPAFTVSTACSSSAKVFCSAARMLQLGMADAVVVGGVDSLCASTLFGFHALGLVSDEPCRPFAADRRGINLGEAAGFALLERGAGPRRLLGAGESSDAHHMSAPDPAGAGAEIALDAALATARIDAAAIEHVQLHGTGTQHNDAAESALLARRYTAATIASSTKGMVGHTLGAAGILGSVFCWLALDHGEVAGTVNTTELAPGLWPHVALRAASRPIALTATHNFAFGGSNCVLIWAGGETAAVTSGMVPNHVEDPS